MITVAASSLTGCMLSPTDDAHVGSVTDTLAFEGYVTEPGAPVQIRAWDHAANAMVNVGSAVLSATTPTELSDGSLYYWSAPQVLPAQFWRTGPNGGQCAAVGAQTRFEGATHDVITVESNWRTCLDDHPSIGEFYGSCRSDHSPVALIYTNDWRPITVDQHLLDLAGLFASTQISLTLDNYTPIQGQFCNSGNPAGCPPGLSDDPKAYEFFRPNASSLTQTGHPPLTFSITPVRNAPMTVYIDNMSSQSLDFTTSGDKFVLGINFESAGPEIRMDCVHSLLCPLLGDPTVELGSPRAVIRFSLATDGGHVVYTSATTTFSTSSTDDKAIAAASGIATAMTDKLNNEPSIKAAVADALDGVIRQTANLGAGLPIDRVTIGGGEIRVLPACPLD
jgi:hypothetical protein